MQNESIYNAIREAIQIYGGPPYVFQLLEQAGKEEITYLMAGNEVFNYEEREECAIELLTRIRRCIEKDSSEKISIFMYLKRKPIFEYIQNLSILLKIYIEEGMFERDAIYNFGINLATESRYDQLVKLGILILGNFENDFTKKVIQTLGYHSEFTLYAIEAVSRFDDSNELIKDFLYNTDGYGKLVSAIKYKPVTKEGKEFLLESALYLNSYVKFDLSYVTFERMLMRSYFEEIELNDKNFSRLSYLIAMTGSRLNLKTLKVFGSIIDRYMFSAYSRKSTYMDLAAVLMIKKSMEEKVELDHPEFWPDIRTEQIIRSCEAILARMDFKKLIMSELVMNKLEVDEIGLMLRVIEEIYNTNGYLVSYRIFDMMFELAPFLYELIDYFVIAHPEKYIEHVFEYIKDKLPSEVLNGDKENFDAQLKYLPDVWLVYILKTMIIHEIYDEEFFIECLNARFKDVRIEASKCLEFTRDKWSERVEPAIEEAFKDEPSFKHAEYLKYLIKK